MFSLMWEKSRNLTPVISRFSKGINTKLLVSWANDASQGLALGKRSFLLCSSLPSVNILAKFSQIGNELDVKYLGHSGISNRGLSRKAYPPKRKSKPPRYAPTDKSTDTLQAPASKVGKKKQWDLNKWTQEGVNMSKRVVPYFKGALRKQVMKRKQLKEAQAEEKKRKIRTELALLEEKKRHLLEAALMEEKKRQKLEAALFEEKRENVTSAEETESLTKSTEERRNVAELRSEVPNKKEIFNQNHRGFSNEQMKTSSDSGIKDGSGEGDQSTKTSPSSDLVKKRPIEESQGPTQGRKRAKTLLDVLSERRQQFPKPRRITTDVRIRPMETLLPISQENLFEFFGKRGMVDAATLDKLETGFKKLECSDSKSLLKKYLTRDVFDKLKNQKTPTFGSTLLDCIQSGLENHDSGVGIYAPDAEAYSVFADLFDPIIQDYHGGFQKCDKHPAKDWGDVDTFANLDPAGEFIISTRVRCGRSLQGYPFNPCLTEAQYKEMEDKMSCTLSSMSGELKGTYYPLTGMSKPTQQQLIDDHFLFKEGDRFLQAANACRFWPSGRGIYHNDDKTFLVWVNEEDHLRLISMQMGGDLGQVYRRLVSAVNEIEKKVPFSHDDRLGFLTFCPTNLGTTVRASVHIKVPKLASNKQKLEEVAGKYNLQVRGTRGEHTEAEGGVYDISNKRRMGLTEFQAVKEMNDGIAEIIKIEREL